MSKVLVLALAVFALFLSGCAAPTPEEIARADYGTYPSNYEQIIKSYLSTVLKDPSSAEFNSMSSPKTGWTTYGGGKKFGYVVCARINTKNSFGGYVGFQPYYFMIKNGVVISSVLGSTDPFSQGIASSACKGYL
jgi:hypothetical protein